MSIDPTLLERANSQCELCGASDGLTTFEAHEDEILVTCSTCHSQIEQSGDLDVHHWRCLNDSMWSQEAAVQIMAWRLLTRLAAQGEGWAQDALDMLYLEEDVLAKAKADLNAGEDDDGVIHKDSNGAVLNVGDTVTLIKDLNVKGAGFTAKRGTAVRNISLVPDNASQIEGRVNGQQIVILTQFVKKTS